PAAAAGARGKTWVTRQSARASFPTLAADTPTGSHRDGGSGSAGLRPAPSARHDAGSESRSVPWHRASARCFPETPLSPHLIAQIPTFSHSTGMGNRGQAHGCNFFNHNKDLEQFAKFAKQKPPDKSGGCSNN